MNSLSILLSALTLSHSRHDSMWFNLPVDMKRSIVSRAGFDWDKLIKNTCRLVPVDPQMPAFRFRLTPEFKQLVSDQHMIYGPNSHDYYAELIENGRLFFKYNTILGQRHADTYSAEDMEQIIEHCVALVRDTYAKHVSPRQIAAASAVSIEQEVELLVVDGDALVLPTVQLKHYDAIKALVANAGGKYQRPDRFKFPAGIDPAKIHEQLRTGNVVNIQQETQFFATPAALANRVVGAVGDLSGKRVLEPSAGQAALADPARQAGADVVTVESYRPNADVLRGKGYVVYEQDFMSLSPRDLGTFDVILANPPFTKDQDAEHLQHMLQFLRPGGVLSIITSTRWKTHTGSKTAALREWIQAYGVEVHDVPPGTFASSGTQVATTHLVYRAAPAMANSLSQVAA